MEALEWLDYTETEFYNVEMPDERIAFCTAVLEQFPDDRETKSFYRRGLADGWRQKAGRARAAALYDDWLRADPQWGWGYIGQADLWSGARVEEPDAARAESILRAGLAVAGVRDRKDIMLRLADVYGETGRRREAESALAGLGTDGRESGFAGGGGDGFADDEFAAGRAEPQNDFSMRPPGVPLRLEAPKVGRNQPCPCGSGRKHKHCCGR